MLNIACNFLLWEALHRGVCRPINNIHPVGSETAHKKEEPAMSTLIPQDIEFFLYDIGTLQGGAPGAFEEYAKTAAALLWEKYVILEDPSIQVQRNAPKQQTSSGWREVN
jgi:hypothetical protein